MTHPAIYPFPHDLYWPNGEENELPPYVDTTFYNDPTKDGVQYNILIGGDPAMWDSASASYDPGIPDASNPYTNVQGAVYTPGPPAYLDLWRYNAGFSIAAVPAYTQPAGTVKFNTPVETKLYEYPGVASTASPFGSGYFACLDIGKPALIELWFSDNPNRTGGTVFNGYTHFGDQSSPAFSAYTLGNPGEYVRKYVSGVLKLGADSSNPAVGDIIYGAMFTGTPAGGEAVVVVNGVVRQSATLIGRPTSCEAYIDTAFSGDPAVLNGYASGSFGDLGIFVVAADGATHVDVTHYPVDTGLYGFDTLDVKFVAYVDRVSGLGEGVPTGSTWSLSAPSMYTHPGWASPVFWTNFLGQREIA